MQAAWMERHQEALWNQSIRDIVWPGAHDAGTGKWQTPLALVPDRPTNRKIVSIWQKLNNCCLLRPAAKLLAGRISRLAKAQVSEIGGQLRSGARYFDLRLYFTDEGLFLTHCAVGESVWDALNQVRLFCEENPGEILILHERARVNVTLERYEEYIRLLKNVLGELLVPSERNVHVTYGELIGAKQRVIYMLSSEGQRDPPVDPVHFPGDPLIWPPRFRDRWPNAQTVDRVERVFDKQFREWKNEKNRLTIAQIVISPTMKQYCRDALCGLTLQEIEEDLVASLPALLQGWGSDKEAREGMNILMFDFDSLGEGVLAAIRQNLL